MLKLNQVMSSIKCNDFVCIKNYIDGSHCFDGTAGKYFEEQHNYRDINKSRVVYGIGITGVNIIEILVCEH